MPRLVIWTDVTSENWGENGTISCFHLSFHPSFHPLQVDMCPQIREITCNSEEAGDKCGDGKRAVATPLFRGKNRPKCRAGSVRVPPHSRVATARSPVPIDPCSVNAPVLLR